MKRTFDTLDQVLEKNHKSLSEVAEKVGLGKIPEFTPIEFSADTEEIDSGDQENNEIVQSDNGGGISGVIKKILWRKK